ncbi:MAG: acetylxylan esterase [Armatimonadetes bacterium]|nr:acetylxylan esterase [Armatimonadota bacterium]
MLSQYLPEDFVAFWEEATAEADGISVDFERRKTTMQNLPEHEVELIDFLGMLGARLHGWIAIPRENPAPGFLWIPAYGHESHLPNEHSTRLGMASMSFNFHGHGAFHQEEYRPARGYFAQGIEDPRTWIFRSMAQNCLVAMRVLQAQPEAGDLSAAGLSQGGGMAIWTAAHSPLVKNVVADLPFLSAMRYTLGKELYRYPLKEVADFAATIPSGMERVLRSVSYFDTVNQATRLKVPTLVSLGKKDPAVRADTVRAVYEAIPSQKKLIEYDTGHDWNPAMIDADLDWMLTEV